MVNKEIIQIALATIELEATAVAALKIFINKEFELALTAINNSKGRLIVSGVGKSAIIAQKIVATFNSTGTPAIFMHSADAIHGDLGMVQGHDIVLLISKSGNSPEIKVLIPLIKNFGNLLIGMVGNIDSFLAKQCDIVLNTTVEQEACPNNLAPTTSTTAQMVMGDTLAVCLMEMKKFNSTDFAKFHPGGALGKKLYLRVADICMQNEKPSVFENSTISDVIIEITKKRLGATVVLNSNEITGIITDGDLRRMLSLKNSLDSVIAKDIMCKNPVKVEADLLASDALEIMKNSGVNQLIVINNNNEYFGIVHLQDFVREGIF